MSRTVQTPTLDFLTSGVPLDVVPSSDVHLPRDEPVTLGIPIPRSRWWDPATISLSANGAEVPLQATVIDRWSDGSLRWVLLDFSVALDAGAQPRYRLAFGSPPVAHQAALVVSTGQRQAVVDTGQGVFELGEDGMLRFRAAGLSSADFPSTFQVVDGTGATVPLQSTRVAWEETGPLRSCLLMTAHLRTGGAPLEMFARYHFFAGRPLVRIRITLRNPTRAVHAGGFWDLGDAASRCIRDFSYVVTLPDGSGTWDASCSVDPRAPLESWALPFELYQDSSGGDRWQSSNHLNRDRQLSVRSRGYRLQSGTADISGLRATPTVVLRNGPLAVRVAQRYFWQRFPKAIEARGGRLRLGLLPRESAFAHELQGGEQVTEEFVLAFGAGGIAPSLDWVRDPVRVSAPPQWYCDAEAMPHLTPGAGGSEPRYQMLVDAAIEGDDTFDAKRERIDEYGWRNFGDLYADHETVKHAGPSLFISHYNNQYDAIAGFACQFFRSGDLRWLTLMDDLARHVIDIDIYHTAEDKPAYNQGLFWHTAHHTDADLATHRTFPRSAAPASGGPSPEHNYNTGLMLYYFLTGDAGAREAAVGLGSWVIGMDDGGGTPLRWFSRGPTGTASATGSIDYHGPGRAPGNSIVSLLNACRLSGDRKYLLKAESLLRRCIHPADDLPGLDLLDAERRWYYTVFLQAVGRYLDFKAERGEIDGHYAYARAALLHYAEWMADHEYPYLEKPSILEYPTETWAAQDMRKCEVFQYAALHASSPARSRFLEKADFFYEYSVSTLLGMKTRTFTRPVVVMLSNGYAHEYFRQAGMPDAPAPRDNRDFGRPVRFAPQRAIALRRLAVGAGLAAAMVLGTILWLVA